VFYDYSVKWRKLPPEGLFFKNSEGVNESLPFFILKPFCLNSQLRTFLVFWHRVKAAFAEGLAAQYSPNGKPHSFYYAMLFQCFYSII
jgi:hypothetical protein